MKATKQQKRIRRHNRIRAKVIGTSKLPRLCVFRSNQHIIAQVIDDLKGKTIVQASDMRKSKVKSQKPKIQTKSQSLEKELTGKVALAFEVGNEIAKLATEKKITKVIFDRGGYKYHGRVKALAEGARQGGLKF
ncbi:MAG: 50S ribosomal protein L18 [Candidatus Pacebacteria bacterium]|nr:50S ribosomal protein L18 [Candidatus Paceibacterota bacterium]